jgi:hypothetical protein
MIVGLADSLAVRFDRLRRGSRGCTGDVTVEED